MDTAQRLSSTYVYGLAVQPLVLVFIFKLNWNCNYPLPHQYCPILDIKQTWDLVNQF